VVTGSGPIGPEGHLFTRDRDIAARVAAAQPLVLAGVRANRAFLRRTVAYLAGLGIDQFLDQQTLVKVP